MNSYELTFILKPNLSDKERDDCIVKIEKWIEEGKGKVEKKDIWGKKPFAYQIKKLNEGIYIFMALGVLPKEVTKIDRKLKLDESVLRYLLVKTQKSHVNSKEFTVQAKVKSPPRLVSGEAGLPRPGETGQNKLKN